MAVLGNRFRDVTVTLVNPAPLPSDLPVTWLEPPERGLLLRFVQSDYSEDAPRELARAIPSARDIAFEPMTLRQIFLAIAKAGRGRTSPYPTRACPEKEA